MAKLLNQHGTTSLDSDVVAAAIRAASVAVGVVHIRSTEDPVIANTGIIIGKIAKEIIAELRRG